MEFKIQVGCRELGCKLSYSSLFGAELMGEITHAAKGEGAKISQLIPNILSHFCACTRIAERATAMLKPLRK